MYGGDGDLLTSTRDVVSPWDEYFEDLFNPIDKPDVGPPISGAEVSEVVERLLGGMAPGVDKVCQEFLKTLDVVGLSWLTLLL